MDLQGTEVVRVSDLCVVDSRYRLFRKAESVLARLQRYLTWYEDKGLLTELHQVVYHQAVATLSNFISLRLDVDDLKNNTPPILAGTVRQAVSSVFFGLPEPPRASLTELEQAVVDQMELVAVDMRIADLSTRLRLETAYRLSGDQPWYGIFQSLTVNQENYHAVFSKNSTAWTDYRRAVDRQVAIAAFGSVRAAQGQDYHSLFAVIEEGSLNRRLHIHCLHLMKALPQGACDPNFGLSFPYRRELTCMKPLWAFGNSVPKMVRYSPRDAFGLAGYRWPVDRKTGQALPVKSPMATAVYLMKYVKKTLSTKQRSEYQWRIRLSQSLGKNLLSQLVKNLTNPQLQLLANGLEMTVKLGDRAIPQTVLRRQALRSLRDRIGTMSLNALAVDVRPRLSPLMLLRAGTPSTPVSSSQNISTTPTSITSATAISDLARALTRAADDLNERYFRRPRISGAGTPRDWM